jgi:hypothetical protein
MDWCVGGSQFAGRVSDWEKCGTAGVTAKKQRVTRRAKDLTQRIRRKTEDRETAGEILHPLSQVQDDGAL